jgi:hypothetical protein
MQKNSGLRGLTFYYPGQRFDALVPYPYLVQGRGADIYVINVTAMNPYKMLDFKTYRCDRHYIEYPAGAPLKVGIAVGGGSVGGEVLNTQFNSNSWAWSPFPDCPGMSKDDISRGYNRIWIFQYKYLDAFLVGDCTDEIQYQNTVFGSHYGLHFIYQNGRGASGLVLGHGADGSMVPIAFDGLSPRGIDVINSQLVSMYCCDPHYVADKHYIYCGKDLKSSARMYNTTLWGTPTHSAIINGGSLTLELASFCMYAPFVVDGGELNLTNTILHQSTAGDSELSVKNGAKVFLTANMSPKGMRANEDASQSAITEKLAGQRN